MCVGASAGIRRSWGLFLVGEASSEDSGWVGNSRLKAPVVILERDHRGLDQWRGLENWMDLGWTLVEELTGPAAGLECGEGERLGCRMIPVVPFTQVTDRWCCDEA